MDTLLDPGPGGFSRAEIGSYIEPAKDLRPGETMLEPLNRTRDLWLSAMLRSYHSDRAAKFNENNLGVGFEYGLSPDLRAVGGTYENSVSRRSNYAGMTWMPWRSGNWRLGGVGGAVSGYPGYNYGWGPMVAPMLSYESGDLGANLLALPKFGDVSPVVALQAKMRF